MYVIKLCDVSGGEVATIIKYFIEFPVFNQ